MHFDVSERGLVYYIGRRYWRGLRLWFFLRFEESGLHSGTHCMVDLYPLVYDVSIRPVGIEI